MVEFGEGWRVHQVVYRTTIDGLGDMILKFERLLMWPRD